MQSVADTAVKQRPRANLSSAPTRGSSFLFGLRARGSVLGPGTGERRDIRVFAIWEGRMLRFSLCPSGPKRSGRGLPMRAVWRGAELASRRRSPWIEPRARVAWSIQAWQMACVFLVAKVVANSLLVKRSFAKLMKSSLALRRQWTHSNGPIRTVEVFCCVAILRSEFWHRVACSFLDEPTSEPILIPRADPRTHSYEPRQNN